MNRNFEYDVALSFAGEQREYVQEVAECLKESNIKVYYDEYDDLWGKDLYQHLDKIYCVNAKFVIIFSSEEYAKKIWTNHELKSAQERALNEKREYILPVRFDDTKIPGIRDTVKYEDARILSPEELCDKFLKKLNAPALKEMTTELKSGSNSIKEIVEKKTKEIEFRNFRTSFLESEAAVNISFVILSKNQLCYVSKKTIIQALKELEKNTFEKIINLRESYNDSDKMLNLAEKMLPKEVSDVRAVQRKTAYNYFYND